MKELFKKVSTIINYIAKPVVGQLPFFVATFLMWVPLSCLEVKDAITDVRYERILDFIQYFGIAVIYSYLLTCIVFALKRRWVKILFYALSLSVFFVTIAVRKVFQTAITPDILLLVAETNAGEAGEFLRNYLFSRGSLVSLAAAVVMCGLIAGAEYYYHRKPARNGNAWLNGALVVLLLVCLPCVGVYVKLLSAKTMPEIERFVVQEGDRGMDNLTSVLYSMRSLALASSEVNSLIEATTREYKLGDAYCSNQDSISVIVVIGESYNKRHAGIYGYRLNTTPRLNEEVQRGNLIVFDDVISPYNTTSRTLKKVFSAYLRQRGENWNEHPMLMSVFKHAGYDVTWWDNQLGLKKQKNVFSFSLNSILFNKDILDCCYTRRNEQSFPYDGELVDDFITSHVMENSQSAKKLHVFHFMGQHVMAVLRYPQDAAHNHFTKDSVLMKAAYIDDAAREQIAQYDNATLYHDEVIGRLLELFRNQNAVLVYFSDHGEEVYDYRYSLGRSHSEHKSAAYLKSQNDIPFMVWCSDKYMQTHPQVMTRLKNAVHRPFMNTDVAQILLDLGEISSSHRLEQYNPISESYQGTPRIVYDNLDYDSIVGR